MASSDFSFGFLLYSLYRTYISRYNGYRPPQPDRRSLLFRHLLSQHSVLPSLEGVLGVLLLIILHRFLWLFAGTYSARLPLVPLPGGHFGVARFTLVVACTCCFASLSQGVISLQHIGSSQRTGDLLRGLLLVTTTGLSPASRRRLFRTH